MVIWAFFLVNCCFIGVFSETFPYELLPDIFNIMHGRQLDHMPRSARTITESDVDFYLNTRNLSEKLNNQNLADVDPQKPIKYIVHGWTESYKKPWYEKMTKAYLKNGDYNIIQVDWHEPASERYVISAWNTRSVGSIIGRHITALHKLYGVDLDNVHIIGHSLGSHVAGFAGKEVQKNTGEKIGRITALDPAGPLFDSMLVSKSNKLNEQDAKMVDVIHTDAGVFGYKGPLGTVDFYPNGGRALQPGCYLTDLGSGLSNALGAVFCSHAKSHEYFINTIGASDYMAKKCRGWTQIERGHCTGHEKIPFGEATPRQARGIFYLKTDWNDIHGDEQPS